MVEIYKFEGKVWIFGDDINTDYIMPGFTPKGLSMKERTAYAMRAIRPKWAKEVKSGDVIVAGRNFGCGSNRPAPMILKLLGLSVIVAESINSLFLRNCINYAMPALPCRGVSEIFTEGDLAEVELSTGTVKNSKTNKILRITPFPMFLMEIMKAGGLITLLEKEGHIEKEINDYVEKYGSKAQKSKLKKY